MICLVGWLIYVSRVGELGIELWALSCLVVWLIYVSRVGELGIELFCGSGLCTGPGPRAFLCHRQGCLAGPCAARGTGDPRVVLQRLWCCRASCWPAALVLANLTMLMICGHSFYEQKVMEKGAPEHTYVMEHMGDFPQ